jgi:hypothetical protein
MAQKLSKKAKAAKKARDKKTAMTSRRTKMKQPTRWNAQIRYKKFLHKRSI